MADYTLDARGLTCPLPVLKARRALKDVPSAGVLEVWATDPSSVADFEAFCEAGGYQLLMWDQHQGVYRFLIQNKP